MGHKFSHHEAVEARGRLVRRAGAVRLCAGFPVSSQDLIYRYILADPGPQKAKATYIPPPPGTAAMGQWGNGLAGGKALGALGATRRGLSRHGVASGAGARGVWRSDWRGCPGKCATLVAPQGGAWVISDVFPPAAEKPRPPARALPPSPGVASRVAMPCCGLSPPLTLTPLSLSTRPSPSQ